MSASSPSDGRGPPDRRQSFTKFMTRAKTVLKREKAKRESSTGDVSVESPSSSSTPMRSPPLEKSADVAEMRIPAPARAAAVAGPTSAAGPSTSTSTTQEGKKPARDPAPTEPAPTKAGPAEAKATSYAAIQQEKARALFEKYGLTLEPHEWPQPTTAEPVERVQKAIRMRVHRQCHRCQATYGANNVCGQCSHKRCKKCPRYPIKKAKQAPDHGKVAGITAVGESIEAERAKLMAKYRFVVPAQAEKQDRVRKPIKMRARRQCHRCDRAFVQHEKTCAGCGHVRCSKCPRDPPKLHKYPNGYPGDAAPEDEAAPGPAPPRIKERTFKKVRMPVRWFCHDCDHLFIQRDKSCPGCDHQRCDQCRRVPPKKVKLPPDEAVVKSVEAKLAALLLRDPDVDVDRDRDPVRDVAALAYRPGNRVPMAAVDPAADEPLA
ncbi:MAG: hypothetical protein M1826_000636 [Phylliscum demangeonii]|nr:MAG: hypothetical protein M1826_000636 [Phylliscum demangeonii]